MSRVLNGISWTDLSGTYPTYVFIVFQGTFTAITVGTACQTHTIGYSSTHQPNLIGYWYECEGEAYLYVHDNYHYTDLHMDATRHQVGGDLH